MLHGLVLTVLLWLSIQDVRHRRVMPAGYVLLLMAVLCRIAFHQWSIQTALTGMLGMFVLMFGTYCATKGCGIGGGDVKLLTLLGGYLGLENALLVLFFGGLCLCVRYFGSITDAKKRTVALVPYLTIGAVAVMVLEKDIFSFV